MIDIEERHPLIYLAKTEHIIPALGIFNSCINRKPDFKRELRKTLLKEMKIKIPKGEAKLLKDPFLILGYGVNAYFDIMVSLSIMFCCITLFLAPVYANYAYNDIGAMKNYPSYGMNQFTLGNYGGASQLCLQKRIQFEKMKLECPAGVMIIGDTSEMGIISADSKMSSHCT